MFGTKKQKDPKPLPTRVTIEGDDVHVFAGDTLIESFRWPDLVSVRAWKQDCWGVDRIWLGFDVEGSSDPVCVHEEMTGYDALVTEMQRRCEHYRADWWSVVAFPAFDENHTQVWARLPDPPPAVIIRDEVPTDREHIHTVHSQAFPTPAEANLVDALHSARALTFSLVAQVHGRVAAHVAASPCTLNQKGEPRILGLGPIGVLPEHQRQGLGSGLIRTLIARAADRRFDAIVVLGDPDYYARFGFIPAEHRALTCIYDPPPGAFRVLELRPAALKGCSGLVEYHPAFASFV
ncbi:MAG TPA: N-acetyltransferase [Phycisphaerales bacterium]|nr:N-acetyltransferase [Phycisphaerales bacterium]